MNELIPIEQKIHEIRGQKVMLDFDLAEMYQTETKLLKRAVRRNTERFPEDFMFELSMQEWKELVPIWNQFPENIKHSSVTPFAFTEQGVAMLSAVLHTDRAVQVSINIMRAFVVIRNYLANNVSASKEIEDLKKEIKLLNSNMSEVREDIEALNQSQENTDEQMEDVFQAFAKFSAQIQSKTAQLERIRIKGF
jgi:predicted RNase H-like nuclease (RuvC/YqgF family)